MTLIPWHVFKREVTGFGDRYLLLPGVYLGSTRVEAALEAAKKSGQGPDELVRYICVPTKSTHYVDLRGVSVLEAQEESSIFDPPTQEEV